MIIISIGRGTMKHQAGQSKAVTESGVAGLKIAEGALISLAVRSGCVEGEYEHATQSGGAG